MPTGQAVFYYNRRNRQGGLLLCQGGRFRHRTEQGAQGARGSDTGRDRRRCSRPAGRLHQQGRGAPKARAPRRGAQRGRKAGPNTAPSMSFARAVALAKQMGSDQPLKAGSSIGPRR